MLVVKDERSRSLFAPAVAQKSLDNQETASHLLARDVSELGYRQICLKCDQEPITVAVMKRAVGVMGARVMVDQVLRQYPSVGDSQANGSTDNGVKTVMVQFRTLRLALEERLLCREPLSHAIITWMACHAAILLTRFCVGHDGHTAWERLRGKPYRIGLPGFAEAVWRPLARKGSRQEAAGKLEPRWAKAVFWGLVPRTPEFYVWDGQRAASKGREADH